MLQVLYFCLSILCCKSVNVIKKAMTFIINLAFNRNKSKPLISVYNNSSNFVKKPRSSTIYFDNVSLS